MNSLPLSECSESYRESQAVQEALGDASGGKAFAMLFGENGVAPLGSVGSSPLPLRVVTNLELFTKLEEIQRGVEMILGHRIPPGGSS